MYNWFMRKWSAYIIRKNRNGPIKTYVLDVPYRFTITVEARTKYDASNVLWPHLSAYDHDYRCYILDKYLKIKGK